MRRHLLVTLLAVVGMLVWTSGALAADSLTLCVSKNGAITAAAACKTGETQFDAVSKARVDALQARVVTLESKVAALEALLAGVSRTTASGYDTLLLAGMNLQLVNGVATHFQNGLGNMIIGYNLNDGDTKTGSHNLVIGDMHSYTSTAGIVAGHDNKLLNQSAFVTGFGNTAGGVWSFVGGGEDNTASGMRSFVGGGQGNIASGTGSFVGGGVLSGPPSAAAGNTASGVGSFVGGGTYNVASSPFGFVAGGTTNTAGGQWSFVGGGGGNTASGIASFVAGGIESTASGPQSFTTGQGQNATGFCASIWGTTFGTC